MSCATVAPALHHWLHGVAVAEACPVAPDASHPWDAHPRSPDEAACPVHVWDLGVEPPELALPSLAAGLQAGEVLLPCAAHGLGQPRWAAHPVRGPPAG